MTASTATRTFAIDASHASIGFSVRHLMISKVRGSFASVTGTIELPETGVIPVSVKAEIEAGSINTREDNRDAHLKSADFFEVGKYPKLTFESTKIEATDATHFHLTGDLEPSAAPSAAYVRSGVVASRSRPLRRRRARCVRSQDQD